MSDPVPPEALLTHADFVRGLAWSLLGDEHKVDDVVQQTFMAALERPPAQEGRVRAWLGVVTRNLSLRMRRADRRRRRFEQEGARPVRVPSAEQVREREVTRSQVVDAVLALPEPYRTVVLLRYFECLPPREIAAHTGVPVETARTRLKRAVVLLRERLDAEHGGDRERWRAGLLVWAGGTRAATPPAAPTPATSATGGAGMAAMINRGIGGAAVVAVAAGGWLALKVDDPSEPGEAGGTDPSARVQAPKEPATEAPPLRGRDRAKPGRAARPAADRPASETSASETSAPEPSATPRTVRGRVVDEEGKPLPGARVVVLSQQRAKDREASAWSREEGLYGYRGRVGDDGTFQIDAPPGKRVLVRVGRSPFADPLEGQETWVEPPARDVVLTARRVPVSMVIVNLIDGVDGTGVAGFRCRLQLGKESWEQEAQEGRIELPFRVQSDAPRDLTVTLVDPPVNAPLTRSLTLAPNARVVVTLELPRRTLWNGAVFDADGNPLADAVVFVGTPDRGRGRRWTDWFSVERIGDAVKSGEDGTFRVQGDGRWITAYHEAHGLRTVPASEAARIALPRSGALRGRLLDPDGKPVAEQIVKLDFRTEATTDADGRFAFENVHAGAHWLHFPRPFGRAVSVNVNEGPAQEVVLSGWIAEAVGEVRAGGEPAPDEGFSGAVVGFEAPATLHEFRVHEGRIRVGKLLPGRYFFFSRSGRQFVADVRGKEFVADIGKAAVTVRGTPGTVVYLVPSGCSGHVHHLAGTIAKAIPDTGELKITPLPAGTYDVHVRNDGVRKTIEVPADGTTVDLD